MKKVIGVTLLELMIASVLCAIISMAVISICSFNMAIQKRESLLEKTRHDALKALHILTVEIKQPALWGCGQLKDAFPIWNDTSYLFTAANQLEGDSKSVTVRYSKPVSSTIISIRPAFAKLIVQAKHHFNESDILVLWNCEHAEIIKLKQVNRLQGLQVLIAEKPLHYLFDLKDSLGYLVINRFYIDSALYMENIHHQKIRLVDSIKSMQLEYYLNEYAKVQPQPSSISKNGAKVGAIGVELLLQANSFSPKWYGFVSRY